MKRLGTRKRGVQLLIGVNWLGFQSLYSIKNRRALRSPFQPPKLQPNNSHEIKTITINKLDIQELPSELEAELKRYNKIVLIPDATLRAVCRGPDCLLERTMITAGASYKAREAELKRCNKIVSIPDATLRAICRGPDCFIGTDDDTACGLSFIHMHVNEREHTVHILQTTIVKRELRSTADYPIPTVKRAHST